MTEHPDYYLFTSRTNEHPAQWGWEIRRRSSPMGVKLREDGYQSASAALFAGNKALSEFLTELAKNERRSRK
jgi:hypothetical protein